MKLRKIGFRVASLLLLWATVACAPTAGAPPPQENSAFPPLAQTPSGPKVITIAIQREPPDFGFGSFTGTRTSGGARNSQYIPHDALAVLTDQGSYRPQLAVELPSVDKGTWRINADGTMDTVWKLHPNVRWHDGVPFTSDDLMFSFLVYKDTTIPASVVSTRSLMASSSAPDPHTFVIHWTSTYHQADSEQPGTVKPKHLTESLYESNKEAFINSPIFTHEFVGLGPYKLERWERGSHMEFTRFDQYYQGRPPFDRVVLRFLGDPNTMVANILAGEVDAVIPIGVPLETAMEVEQRWAGTGNQVRADLTGRFQIMNPPHNPETTRPSAFGFTERIGREALYRAIDRPSLAEVATLGKGPVADSWIAPNSAIYAEVAASVPQFPYDPARAQQLLAQLGWERGRDGILVHRVTGDRFATEIIAYSESTRERELAIISDGWKTLGVETNLNLLPQNLISAELLAKHPGPFINTPTATSFAETFLHSKSIPTESNRWSGQNRKAYHNPRVDSILDQLQITIGHDQRIGLHRQLLQEMQGDLAVMPLYWEVVPVLTLKGVKTNRAVGADTAWAFLDWDKE